jgi:hypothetical protein
VTAGNGWQADVWPLPLCAVSGFAYGIVLDDPQGTASEAANRLDSFPQALIEHSRRALADELPGYDGELAGCVRRGDGWLFHHLLTRLMRTFYVAWFSKHRRYCPHPKRLSAWADRFGLDQAVVELDRRMWTATELESKREFCRAIAEWMLQHR